MHNIRTIFNLLFIITFSLSYTVCAKSLNDIMHEKKSLSVPTTQTAIVPPAVSVQTSQIEDAPIENVDPEPQVDATQPQEEVHVNNSLIEPLLTRYIDENFPEQEMKVKLPVINHTYQCNVGAKLTELEIENLEFNNERDFFKGSVRYCRNTSPHHFQGQIENYISIPALSRPIHAGETITEKDIVTIQIPYKKVSKNTVTRVSDLLGTEPKHGLLKPNVPVLQRDLNRPYEVKKGAHVTITYIKPNIVISAKGKALSNGHIGDVIDVQNIDSNKTIKTTVEGKNHVFIKAIESLDKTYE